MFVQKAEILNGQIRYNKLGKIKADELDYGIADARYVHTQDLATDMWLVNHGLGKYPSVTVIDSGRNMVEGEDIIYIDTESLEIHFGAEFSGIAICN